MASHRLQYVEAAVFNFADDSSLRKQVSQKYLRSPAVIIKGNNMFIYSHILLIQINNIGKSYFEKSKRKL